MSVNVDMNNNKARPTKKANLPEGLKYEIIEGEYHLRRGKFLGEGTFGMCYVYTDLKVNREYCLKVIPKKLLNSRGENQLRNEIKIQRSLNHEGIVKLYHSFEDGLNHYILLEYVDGDTLKDVLIRRESITEPEMRYYISHILSALEFIHQKGYIHRDLKLDNLLLTKQCKIKICDFGLAAELTPDKMSRQTICGTFNFLAPEVLMKNGYGSEVDLWAVGVITFACLFGERPFSAKGTRLLFAKIVASEYNFPKDKKVSDDAKEFIEHLLQIDPNKRPSIRTLGSYDFLNKRTIPKSLNSVALNSDPGLVLRTCDDENEKSTKKQRSDSTSINWKTSARHGKCPFPHIFDPLYKVKETLDVIFNEARCVVENSKTTSALKPNINADLPKFVTKLDKPNGNTVFQMSDGTVGITIQNKITIIWKPGTRVFLLYEKLQVSETEYVSSYHSTEDFRSVNPDLYITFKNEIISLNNVNGIYKGEPIDPNDISVPDIKTTVFPVQFVKTPEFDICVLSDSTLQIKLPTSSAYVIFESKAKRVSFVINKVVYTFGLQELLAAVLKSGATLKTPEFSELVSSSGFNAAELPKMDANRFGKVSLETLNGYFEASFAAVLFYIRYKEI